MIEAQEGGQRSRRVLSLAVRWLVPIIAVAAFALTGHLGDALAALADVRLSWSIPLVLLGIGLPLSHAWRWCFLLERTGATLPVRASARITSLASLINYAAPGFLGAPAKAILARDSHRVPISNSLPTLAIEQLLDVLLLFIGGTIAILVAGPVLLDSMWDATFAGQITLVMTVIVVGAIMGVLLFVLGRRLFPDFVAALRQATSNLLRSPRFRGEIAALTLTRWLLDMLAVAVASIAVGLRLSWIEILLIANISLLVGVMAPVPGGLGIREAAMASIAGLLGLSIPAILALSVLHRAGLALGLPIVLVGARLREWSAQ